MTTIPVPPLLSARTAESADMFRSHGKTKELFFSPAIYPYLTTRHEQQQVTALCLLSIYIYVYT